MSTKRYADDRQSSDFKRRRSDDTPLPPLYFIFNGEVINRSYSQKCICHEFSRPLMTMKLFVFFLSFFRYRVDKFLIITSGMGWVAKF